MIYDFLHRPRRLRMNARIRDMVRETHLRLDDLIYPMFVTYKKGAKTPIASMPNCFQWGIDRIAEECRRIEDLGIPAVILFGIPEQKDAEGTQAYAEDGIIPQAIHAIKKACATLVVMTDVCLCEYTSHGHCGVLKGECILNDESVELLCKEALAHARAGSDVIAPSDMMDGRVEAIRETLDEEGFEYTPILAYSVKYASGYYGPFRDAAESAPAFGDRRSHQMDPPNRLEALRQAELDDAAGADILMVKPALPYLDILRDLRNELNVPLAAYNVSGEYSMVKAAAEKGWIDERRVVMENLIAIKRAGADMILTYHAPDVAIWLQENG
ncbi:MAG: porphobilinogen synthase [Candidatus Omnitrophota bacterium]|jgi:porphobilinogen synthase|nr:MAG: porphobilinogen synthase [Candidatus Omnitrophota bacterium]